MFWFEMSTCSSQHVGRLDRGDDGGEEPRHLFVARRLGGMELEDAVVALGEDAVEHEGVEVDVQ